MIQLIGWTIAAGTVIVVVGVSAVSLLVARGNICRPLVSPTVRDANDRAAIAEAATRTATANAATDIIEAKRRQLLDAVLEKNEAKENALLLEMAEDRDKARYR